MERVPGGLRKEVRIATIDVLASIFIDVIRRKRLLDNPNKPCPSSKNSLSKRGQVKNLSSENEFFCVKIKNIFHIYGFAPRLALKETWGNSTMAYFHFIKH